MLQEQQRTAGSLAPESWQKMLATLLTLNRKALEAKREQEAELEGQQRAEAA